MSGLHHGKHLNKRVHGTNLGKKWVLVPEEARSDN